MIKREPNTLDKSLTPDLSARFFGVLGCAVLAGAIGAVALGAVGVCYGLLSLGLPLVAYQFVPEMDKGAKGLGLLACGAAGLALLIAPAAPLVISACAGLAAYLTQKRANKTRENEEILDLGQRETYAKDWLDGFPHHLEHDTYEHPHARNWEQEIAANRAAAAARNDAQR